MSEDTMRAIPFLGRIRDFDSTEIDRLIDEVIMKMEEMKPKTTYTDLPLLI